MFGLFCPIVLLLEGCAPAAGGARRGGLFLHHDGPLCEESKSGSVGFGLISDGLASFVESVEKSRDLCAEGGQLDAGEHGCGHAVL